MRWRTASAFLHNIIMIFPCLRWDHLPAEPPAEQGAGLLTGASLRYEPGPVKGLVEGAREDGFLG